jgi:ACR3 family arsenite efflux pump ArsB
MSIKSVFTFPARNLIFVVPVIILVAVFWGRVFDTSALKQLILPVAMLTIYPAMIGFQPREVFHTGDRNLLLWNLVLNFAALPLAALVIGRLLLFSFPDLQAGLLIISVVPGGNMVVAFTMMAGGNVQASVRLCTVNLLLGAFLAPVYLYFLAGALVHIDIVHIGKTIAFVVLIPLAAGITTYNLLLRRYSQQEFQRKIKPLLPAAGAWGLMYILFTSVSMKAEMFFSYPELIFQALGSLLLWYFFIFFICIAAGRLFFTRQDAMALVLNVELRNLAIAIGLAFTAFSPQTAMMVALAFLFQQQFAIWFWKMDQRLGLLGRQA